MKSPQISSIAKLALQYLVLCLIAVLCVFPFWWTLVTAISGSGEVFAYPPQIWPQEPTLANFKEVFAVIPMADFFRNSILITVLSVAGKLFFCALAAYPLSRLRFTGRKLVLGIVLATMVLPSEVNFLVNFVTINRLHLDDSILGVIAPNLVSAVSIFMLKQAFDEIPADLIAAARIDGANDLRIFWHIMLPLIAPWLATVGILAAVEAWNDYLWPSIVLSKPESLPLAAGILYLRGTFGSNTRVIAAGTVLTVLPILLAFLTTQRFFMRGMDGAVK